ncbi:helix-turn-helix transcriptional regulator [Undibacterium piscinae]|uniref:Helix-turn-helix transcriptional regulator n=1 Tax=Undibacterium piscinae TaxID=2495591 RepID=A0A6M4A5W4_9BURK|nr:helix-turn-helix transcriptional regulator [Undibacterium piscinae]
MHADYADTRLAQLAAAIAEPARARILCCLMDGHARTSTELATVAEVSPSTTSVHLSKLKQQNLVKLMTQGKHRYYQLASAEVAAALEALLSLAGVTKTRFVPNTPARLRHARTCYDHMAGTVAVQIHDCIMERGWLLPGASDDPAYSLSEAGQNGLQEIGVDVGATLKLRRRFACSCLDWSERRPHLGGALGAALLSLMLQRGWVTRDLDSRALSISKQGGLALQRLFGIAM